VNDVVALALILVSQCPAMAGRVRTVRLPTGYRYGYRQGYFDGDRASWTPRRRDLQAAVASVLNARPEAYLDPAAGTTYSSSALDETENEPVAVPAAEPIRRGRHSRSDQTRSQADPKAMAEIGSDG
jgi:hypothetical protein